MHIAKCGRHKVKAEGQLASRQSGMNELRVKSTVWCFLSHLLVVRAGGVFSLAHELTTSFLVAKGLSTLDGAVDLLLPAENRSAVERRGGEREREKGEKEGEGREREREREMGAYQELMVGFPLCQSSLQAAYKCDHHNGVDGIGPPALCYLAGPGMLRLALRDVQDELVHALVEAPQVSRLQRHHHLHPRCPPVRISALPHSLALS